MQVTIEFSSQLKRAAGQRDIKINVPAGATVSDAAQTIAENIPATKPFLLNDAGQMQPSLILFNGDDQITPEFPLQDGVHILILTPISGG